MRSEFPAFGFSFLGMVFLLLTLFALWRGHIRESYDVVIYRSSDPTRYYALVIGCALLASVLIVAAVYLFLHPGIIPVQAGQDDGAD